MKTITKLPRFLLCILLSAQMVSCGLLDFDVDDELVQTATEMMLNYDTAYAVRGDTLVINPVFKPDSINIKDLYMRSSNTDVLSVSGNRIEAVGTGHATLYIESVSAHLSGSIVVYVMEPWVADTQVYPYETVFYTDVTVDGKRLTEDMAQSMTVAAFVGDECRAIGQLQTFHGIPMVQFRVGSEELYTGRDSIWTVDPGEEEEEAIDVDDEDEGDEELEEGEEDEGDDEGVDDAEEEEGDDDDDDEIVPDSGHWVYIYREQISFRCYDSRRHILYTLPLRKDLDGEAHGRLSDLLKLEFTRKKE